jgi:methionine synthase I (cobalamin-dependent)/5,10-methylenetetrahydrofolate reductase
MSRSHPGKGFRQWIESGEKMLLADGAMGTLLNARGVGFEKCLDALNLSNPELLMTIHQQYIQAGARLILSNTFGANRYKLSVHGLESQVAEINEAGVRLAKQVVDETCQEVFVAGDVGPLGVRIAPFGRVQPYQAQEAFAEQIASLCAAGCDLIYIETLSDLNEMQLAIEAAQQTCDLPILASMTFTPDDRTLLGETPEKVAERLWDWGVQVMGVNCSAGPEQILRILNRMHAAVPKGVYLAKPNAGWPERVNGRVRYPASTAYFGEYARAFRKAGARLVGGCCGTTPEHIDAMRRALQVQEANVEVNLLNPFPENGDPETVSSVGPSQMAEKINSGRFVIAVEMDPPRSSSAHKLLAGASLLMEVGADVINVADSPRARMRMSPWAACSLIQRNLSLETTLHFPTRGRNLLRVQGDLLAAHALGIRNVFVVMGDPTQIGDYPEAMDNYDLVPSGLISLIKNRFNAGLDHGGARIGGPTSFFTGCALNMNPQNTQREIKGLRKKVAAGADFILTQPIFDPTGAEGFLKFYEERFGELKVPILAGILPLFGSRHAAYLHNEVPGIEVPEGIQERLVKAGENAPQEGVSIALELVEATKGWAQGIYLMPAFGRYDLAAGVVEGVRKSKDH